MRVLVIGGTDFVGSPTLKRLSEMGHDLLVFHRGNTKVPDSLSANIVHGDRKNLADFSSDFKAFAPEVVLDMIPHTEQDGRQLISVFGGIAERLVAVSSADVYRAYDRLWNKDAGKPDPTPLTEQSPLRDRLYPYRTETTSRDEFDYHYDKILMEKAVMSEPDALPATVIRLPMVHGSNDFQHRFYAYIKRMLDQRPFILLSEEMAAWRGCRGYVENMAEAVALCVTEAKAANNVYHVAAPTVTEKEWVSRIAKAMSWQGDVLTLPNEQLPKNLQRSYNFSQDWSLDSSFIRTQLDYRERISTDEGVRRTVAWEQDNPPEDIDLEQFNYSSEDATVENNLRT